MIYLTQRPNHSNRTFGWFFHEKVKKLPNHTKMLHSLRSGRVFSQNWYGDSLDHVSMISATFFGEHQLTSKNRHSRTIVVTKILTHPPDDEKSDKMGSFDFSVFKFGIYGQKYARNVPTGFSSAFSQELSRSEQCWPNKKTIEKHP